jgi:serine/threonine protein kinase
MLRLHRFAAPEICQKFLPHMYGTASYDEMVDVYSYGIILFELVTRTNAFDNFTGPRAVEEICAAVAKGKKPQGWTGAQGDDLQRLIHKCWRTEPGRRPHFYAVLVRCHCASTVSAKIKPFSCWRT